MAGFSPRASLKSGKPFIWLTGGALVLSLMMVGALLYLIAFKALGFFWVKDVATCTLGDGTTLTGEVVEREGIPGGDEAPGAPLRHRVRLKIGNRDISGLDFAWIDEDEIVARDYAPGTVVLERTEWGNFYGYVTAVRSSDATVAEGREGAYAAVLSLLPRMENLRASIREIELGDIGAINARMDRLRLDKKRIALSGEAGTEQGRAALAAVEREIEALARDYDAHEGRLGELYTGLRQYAVTVETGSGREAELPLGNILRAYRPNEMGTAGKALLYARKTLEFVADDPRESNTEGGVFPAIFGTVMMVLIMTVAVMPFGVLAALYLREYAKQGPLVRFVRICVNNLAGVPSIVFGVFGLGFFIYGLGGSIDRIFFPEALPTPTFGTGGILWASLTLALLTLPVVIVSTEEGLAAVGQELRHGSLALGAMKFETIVRVVLPSAAPGILTGMILAIARATGEVAPLMITGVVKLAPALPLDGNFPYLHLDRKFMHLGFHIYDVGFQSPNVEAALPMVYLTAFLLIAIVVALNLAAILLRNRLRRRYATAAF
jgi:phosphate transport system permease protein